MNDPLVLLPGMMCDARLFWPQMQELSHSVAVMVMPLGGASAVGALAAQVLDAAPRRFALAGHGLGGTVALEVLRRAPDRVSRIALLDSSSLPEIPAAAAAREPGIVAVRAGRMAEALRSMVISNGLGPDERRIEVLETAVEMGTSMGVDAFIMQSRALQRRPDQQKILKSVKVPACVICGEHDALYPVKRHEVMATLMPNASLHVIAGAGHLSTLEQPEAVLEVLLGWLSKPVSPR